MEYQKRIVTLEVHQGEEVTTVPWDSLSDDGVKTSDIRIPYHAIDYITVHEEVQTVQRPDPYGCDVGNPNALQTEDGTDITNEDGNVIEGV